MESIIKTIVFTDITGSTALTEQKGNENYGEAIREHLRVAESLAVLNEADYHKNIGDANMLSFKYPSRSINYCVQLLEYYSNYQPFEGEKFELKIGIATGVSEEDFARNDLFGSGANLAARVQGVAAPLELWINDDLYKALVKEWGHGSAGHYIKKSQCVNLKGFADEQTIYEFDWKKYREEKADKCLPFLIYNHLSKAKVTNSNFSLKDFATPSTLIWPVVPRNIVTTIHAGQTEIIRLLSLLGWQVHLLIADCGTNINFSPAYCQRFQQKLTRYAKNRGVEILKVNFLSEFFTPEHSDYSLIQEIFRKVTSQLTMQDLLNMHEKSYAEEVKDAIRESMTLDFLKPVLSLTAVMYIAEGLSNKAVVISGQDEENQWNRAYNLSSYDTTQMRDKVGVLMNPILRDEGWKQLQQKESRPSWVSKDSLVNDMKKEGNLAWWLFNLIGFVPVFPSSKVNIGAAEISPDDWNLITGYQDNDLIDLLGEHVWEILSATTL